MLKLEIVKTFVAKISIRNIGKIHYVVFVSLLVDEVQEIIHLQEAMYVYLYKFLKNYCLRYLYSVQYMHVH